MSHKLLEEEVHLPHLKETLSFPQQDLLLHFGEYQRTWNLGLEAQWGVVYIDVGR